MGKKTLPRPTELSFPAQDWTNLGPGQPVRVQDNNGQNFVAVIETKTGNSRAVWIIRDDTRTRQVIGNTEGVELLLINQSPPLPPPIPAVQDPSGRTQCS